MRERAWEIAHDGIIVGGIMEISLQRTVIAPVPPHRPLPSYGRAPLVARELSVGAGVGANEGLWIGFQLLAQAHAAMRVRIQAPLDVDAVTGGAWMPALSDAPPNYLIVPPQVWLAGIPATNGGTQQFVAFPAAERGANCRRLRMELVAVTPVHLPMATVGFDHPSWSFVDDVGVQVDILDAAEFEDLAGHQPPKLVESHRYQGRRLP